MVARQYLRAEPIFLESRLHWYKPGASNNPPHFHYDVGDALSVSFFVFLSDVDDEQAVPHQVVAGTHRAKTLQELWTHRLEDSRSEERRVGKACRCRGSPGHLRGSEESEARRRDR